MFRFGGAQFGEGFEMVGGFLRLHAPRGELAYQTFAQRSAA